LVRGAAIWALRRLDPYRADAQRLALLAAESDNTVRLEWTVELE
jgi:epoxyqueuosine reductase